MRRALLFALSIGVACRVSAAPAVSDAGADAGTDAGASDAGSSDAGSDVDQDPNVYPSQHAALPSIDFLGGPVLDHVSVVTITYQGDPRRDELRAFDDAIVRSVWWRAVTSEYGVSDGASGGNVELPDTLTGTDVLDEQLQAVLARGIAQGTFPTPSAETLYMLYVPAKTTVFLKGGAALSCIDFIGYHGAFELAADGGNIEVPYAVIARCDFRDPNDTRRYLTVAASHVLAEAAADPHPASTPAWRMTTHDAWLRAGGSGAADEAGDRCGFTLAFDDPSGYPVQRMWSNRAAAASHEPCQPAPAASVFFAAAVKTELQTVNGHKSFDYLVVRRGQSVDARVEFFSDAPLPRDATLLTGRARGGDDPTLLDFIEQGITATLSRTVAHNGQGATLTVAVPSSAAPGDYPFVVRAIVDKATFHDWPVLVHVP